MLGQLEHAGLAVAKHPQQPHVDDGQVVFGRHASEPVVKEERQLKQRVGQLASH
jgi:hypothetical protein